MTVEDEINTELAQRYDNYSDEQLKESMESHILKAEGHIFAACEELLALHLRGIYNFRMQHPTYRWYKEIVYRKLTVEIISQFATVPKLLEKLLTFPLEFQRHITDGGMLQVVSLNEDGETIVQEMQARTMRYADLNRIIQPGHLMTVDDQIHTLRAEAAKAKAEKAKRVIADLETGQIIFVNTDRATPEEISAAVLEIMAHRKEQA